MPELVVNLTVSGTITWDDPEPQLWVRISMLGAGDVPLITGETYMAFTLPVDQTKRFGVKYIDKFGNEVDLPQGNVKWESSETTLLGVTPDSDDDQKSTFNPVGPAGAAQVTCTGTTTGGASIVALLDVTLVAGEAVSGTIQPI